MVVITIPRWRYRETANQLFAYDHLSHGLLLPVLVYLSIWDQASSVFWGGFFLGGVRHCLNAFLLSFNLRRSKKQTNPGIHVKWSKHVKYRWSIRSMMNTQPDVVILIFFKYISSKRRLYNNGMQVNFTGYHIYYKY